MKKQKVWHYSVYKDGKLIRRYNASMENAEQIAENWAARIGGKVTKGYTLK